MKIFSAFIVLLAFWLLITFSLTTENIILGVVASLITILFFGKYLVSGSRKLFQPRRYFWFIIYLFIFIWEILKANFDVAYRVIHAAMPIKPGIVRVPLHV